MIKQARLLRPEISHDWRPYAPSWMDHLTRWIAGLPGVYWAYYVAATIVIIVIHALIKWWDGSIPQGTISHFSALNIATAFYYLALIHYLDDMAKHALDRARPVLDGPDELIEELNYRLTTMPARWVWLLTLAGGVRGATLLYRAQIGDLTYPIALFTSLPATVVEIILTLSLNALLFIVIYHTFHQLRTVNTIYTRHVKIDLFDLSPLYSLARLTAHTTIGLFLIMVVWLSTANVGGMTSSVITVLSIFFVLAIITFILPLLGIHHLIENKKRSTQAKASRRLKRCLRNFNRCMDKGEHAEIDVLLKLIEGAERQIAILERVPTWPWQPGMLRGLVTTLLLPIFIWLITRILERFFVL